jgi:hypothetical protein
LNMRRAIIQYAYKMFYIVGIIVIVGATVFRLANMDLQNTQTSSIKNNNSSVQATEKETDTLTSLVIKPLVESPRNKILFDGVFWFLLWILLFLLLPAGLLPLKRFKMFNLEFEIGEKEAAAIEKISENSSKALTMVNYSSEESIIRFFKEFSDQGEVEYQKALEFFLNDLVKGYKEEFNAVIQYKIYPETEVPRRFHALLNESRITKGAIVLNKLESDNPLHNNWLVHAMPDFKLVSVLTSRLTPFDAMDQYLVTFLHNYVYRIVENRNYAMALTELIEEEEDGQAG